MADDIKKAANDNGARKWRFWFLISFSAFLVVTFGLYLPLRFQHQAVERGAPHAAGGEAPGMHAAAQYHEEGEVAEGIAVNLNVTPVPVTVGTSTRLDFFVNEKPGNVPVPASALEIEHTKLMHVIGVREDMNEFFHIHPQPTSTPGVLSVDYAFSKPGLYKIWSEIKKDGAGHAFGHPETSVLGEGPRSEKQVSFGRNAVVELYQVSLELDEPVAKGHSHELAFDIHTVTGDEVALEPYLAADMHLTIIKDDWKQFIHTHPTGQDGVDHHGVRPRIIPLARANGQDISGAVHDAPGEDEAVRFAVTFPESGLYKAFVQFRPRGIGLPPDEALAVSFWIRVEDKAPAAIPDTVLYAAVSLALIVLLSWGVRRYLQGAR